MKTIILSINELCCNSCFYPNFRLQKSENSNVFQFSKTATFKIGAIPNLGAMSSVTKVAPNSGFNCNLFSRKKNGTKPSKFHCKLFSRKNVLKYCTSQTSQFWSRFWARFWLVKRDEISHLKMARWDETRYGWVSIWRDEPRRDRLVSPARAKKTRRALARSTSSPTRFLM